MVIESTAPIAIVGSIYMGATGLPWVWVLAIAVWGCVIYTSMRKMQIIANLQMGNPILIFGAMYISQVATFALLFGIGRGIGYLLS